MNKTVNIIGGAVAGPAAAVTLARLGYDVTVYEQLMPGDLVSQQILGIDPHVWDIVLSTGIDPEPYEIPHKYHIYGTRHSVDSPYHYVPWQGWHDMLVKAATDAGARFVYGKHVRPEDMTADHVIDATGITGAARDQVPFEYSGRVIFRGRSKLPIRGEFTVFQDSVMALAGGDDKDGRANWQLYATRPQPAHLTTVRVGLPPEADRLPPGLLKVVIDTPEILMTPLSFWSVRSSMRRFYRTPAGGAGDLLLIGDVLGAIAPATTAGASLATLEGFQAHVLLGNEALAAATERACLKRRGYVLKLGATLSRPEIGGNHEDPHFTEHEGMIYGGL